jgi:fructose-specific PTS system IIA-like component
MPREHAFTCPLPYGIHARPASALEEVTRRFASALAVVNERNGQRADLKSVLAIVGADIRFNDRCRVIIEGADEEEALAAIARFLDHDLPHCDDALPAAAAAPGEVHLPPLLRIARAEVKAGTAVSQGIGRGRAVRMGGLAIPASIARTGIPDAGAELRRLGAALDAVLRHYDSRLVQLGQGIAADVLRAHRSVARDPGFRRRIEAAIREDGRTLAGAIEAADAHFSAMLSSTGSQLLRERALDVRDVCVELLRQAYGERVRADQVRLAGDSVCVADTLTPGQFLALDRTHLKGLVLAHGGTTSHTVILARSFGIPTLVGVAGADAAVPDGREVIVDADLGVLVTTLTERVRRYYDMEERRLAARRARLAHFAARKGSTADGRHVTIAANIASAAEAAASIAAGAEGIGLFRTEMLFADRDRAPSEDEQFDQYRRAVAGAGGRTVVIRTLDVGGDKPLPYLGLAKEDNPFLGCRAVRLYPEFEAIIRDQVRALVRASAFGKLELLIPMVSTVEEARWVRSVIADEQRQLALAGVPFDHVMAVGAMVEVPSAVFLLDHLCSELDFLSIGTNDLLQYFTAVDRANPMVGALYTPLAPAFVRLLQRIVNDVHARERRIAVCGEMAGDRRCLPLLVGLGIDELSMPAPAIAGIKAELARLSATACQALVSDVVGCSTAAEVGRHLDEFAAARPAPLIDPDLIVPDVDAQSKEEAIKAAVDRLFVAGRAERPRDVEEAVWQREAVYSTGFGHGFAIPHCKADAVGSNALVVLKLRTPVQWGSLDGEPVGTVILLAVRESDQATAHMKVLAALARSLMHEEFRERIAAESDAVLLCEFLAASIGA